MSDPIFLIGYRGTGKTTVARLLAERLGCESIDADDEIERRAGKSIAAIFADDGEAGVPRPRSRRSSPISRAARSSSSRLGGGAVLREANSRRDAGGRTDRLAHGQRRHDRRPHRRRRGHGRSPPQSHRRGRPGRNRGRPGRADADLPSVCYICGRYRRKDSGRSGRRNRRPASPNCANDLHGPTTGSTVRRGHVSRLARQLGRLHVRLEPAADLALVAARRRVRRRVVGSIACRCWAGSRYDREAAIHGRWFWVRPLLLEIGTGAAVAALYWWEIVELGLIRGQLPGLVAVPSIPLASCSSSATCCCCA